MFLCAKFFKWPCNRTWFCVCLYLLGRRIRAALFQLEVNNVCIDQLIQQLQLFILKVQDIVATGKNNNITERNIYGQIIVILNIFNIHYYIDFSNTIFDSFILTQIAYKWPKDILTIELRSLKSN